MVTASKGVLIQCDPSIKAIIRQVDEERGHDLIIEDLDDETLVVKEVHMKALKERLDQKLKDAQKIHGAGPDEESD